MLASCENLPIDPTPLNPPIQEAYQQVEQKLNIQDYFNILQKQETSKNSQQKLISPKMRAKLFGWLEKLALETFHFTRDTLITASAIIDQHL
jgi:hypothetical protein